MSGLLPAEAEVLQRAARLAVAEALVPLQHVYALLEDYGRLLRIAKGEAVDLADPDAARVVRMALRVLLADLKEQGGPDPERNRARTAQIAWGLLQDIRRACDAAGSPR